MAVILSDADLDIRTLFDEAVAAGADPRTAAVWATGEVTGWLRREARDLEDSGLNGRHLAALLALVGDGTLSASGAKDVLDGVARSEGSPAEVAAARNLVQVSDTAVIGEAVEAVLAANPDAVERYRDGEVKIVGFLVGQVMRHTQGRADPKVVHELLADRLA